MNKSEEKTLLELLGELPDHRVGNAIRHQLITAYSSDAQLILGQLCTDEKSNEITAIPKLLKMLTLRGSTVTIDAIGTQKAIAEKIIEREGNYILSLKENHPTLLEDIRLYAQQEVLPKRQANSKHETPMP